MTIRFAEEKDAASILDLLYQVNLIHHQGRSDLFRLGTKYNDDDVVIMVKDRKNPVFVAVDEDDTVLGYAICQHQQILSDPIRTDIRTLYIDDLCVDENHRKKGIGRALYHHVLDYAKKNGYYNVTLNVWALDVNARKFYEKMGLEVQKIGLEKIL
jgi:ribosomal protein S18 acetylase RimI-like enzyme